MTNAISGAFDLNKVELSSAVTVGRYKEMENGKDRNGLADFIQERLSERYVDPLQTAKKKHGFLMMAAACLSIETLESFYRGWPDTSEGKARADIEDPCKPVDPNRTTVSAGEVAFCYFFRREPAFACSGRMPVSSTNAYAVGFFTRVRPPEGGASGEKEICLTLRI